MVNVNLSNKTYEKLKEIKKEEEFKTFDGVVRMILKESGRCD